MKVGEIILWAGSSAPVFCLVCDGAAVSRSTYANLYAIIGTGYGVGDTTTTFNLPDLKGRTPIGSGQGLGLTLRAKGDKVGVETHTLATGEIPAHRHAMQSNDANPWTIGAGTAVKATTGYVGDITQPHYTAYSAAGGAHQNIQPSLCVDFFICYEDNQDLSEQLTSIAESLASLVIQLENYYARTDSGSCYD